MQLNFAYSLKRFIEKETKLPTYLHYDGMKTPNDENLVIIKQRPNEYIQLAKARETVRTKYRFEITIFANSLRERMTYQESLGNSFLFKDVIIYDSSTKETNEKVQVNVLSDTALYPEEISRESTYHRLYFNIEILHTKHKRDYK